MDCGPSPELIVTRGLECAEGLNPGLHVLLWTLGERSRRVVFTQSRRAESEAGWYLPEEVGCSYQQEGKWVTGGKNSRWLPHSAAVLLEASPEVLGLDAVPVGVAGSHEQHR